MKKNDVFFFFSLSLVNIHFNLCALSLRSKNIISYTFSSRIEGKEGAKNVPKNIKKKKRRKQVKLIVQIKKQREHLKHAKTHLSRAHAKGS